MTSNLPQTPSLNIKQPTEVPNTQERVELTTRQVTDDLQPGETQVTPSEVYAPVQAKFGGGGVKSKTDDIEFNEFLKGSNDNVKAFVKDIFNVFGINLTQNEITRLSKVARTHKGAWDFYCLLLEHQVQFICMGFRSSTVQAGNSPGSGPASMLQQNIMGNVRKSQRRGKQEMSEDSQTSQAVNTWMNVIGRKKNISAENEVGFYNNGITIPSRVHTRVLGEISGLKGEWTLDDLSEEAKGIVNLVFDEVNSFFNNRSSRLFHSATCSYFLTEGNEKWLRVEGRANYRAGSYYGIFSNSDTTAGLSVYTRAVNLQNLDGLDATGGSNNTFVLTAEHSMFNKFWRKQGTDKETYLKGAELLMKCTDGEYNRSITLPSGGFVLADGGSPNPSIQDMTSLLVGREPKAGADAKFTKDVSGHVLLGAIALGMMKDAFFPVEEYVDMDYLNGVIDTYEIGKIINPFDGGDVLLKGLPDEVLKASKMVARQEVSLYAAWLVNLITGTVASQKQGAELARQRSQDAVSATSLDEDDVDVDEVFSDLGSSINPVGEPTIPTPSPITPTNP